jgi:alcohol dehydrogenase
MRFHMPTRVIFEPGSLEQLKHLVEEELQTRRPYLVTDRGIRSSGIADRVRDMFPDMPVFDEVEPNPRDTTVDRAGEEARRLQPDLVIGLGGGSVLDAAKAVALLAANPGRIEDFEGKAKYKERPLPVVAVPTTCGTGSEVTWVSVITHTGRSFKMSIKGPEMYPAAALVDPDLLKSLPKDLVASTGLDALTHAVEAYTVKPASPVTDLFARESLRLIFESLEDAYMDIRSHARARENLMLGSMLAGFAFGNSDVGSVHCIAESVGSVYDTPHGVANSIFLPVVMEYNLPIVSARYADIARIAGIDEPDDYKAAKLLVKKVNKLARDLNIPFLRETGVEEGRLLELAKKSYRNNSTPSNPRDASESDYLEMLKKAFHQG